MVVPTPPLEPVKVEFGPTGFGKSHSMIERIFCKCVLALLSLSATEVQKVGIFAAFGVILLRASRSLKVVMNGLRFWK